MHQSGNSSIDSTILLRILCLLPTFNSLFCAVQTSKAFHAVYKENTKRILRAVSYNYVGPAFPLALRLARHDIDSLTEDSATEDSEDELETLVREARSLISNAKLVREWEDLYSWRTKNLRSKTSQLTSLESWRFQKAMYRLMLYSRLFPSDESYYNIIHDGPDQPDAAYFMFGNTTSKKPDPLVALYPELAQERDARREFLSDCFTNELTQLLALVNFLSEIIRWVDTVDGHHMKGIRDYVYIALSTGPAVVLECYKTLGFEPLTEEINKLCPSTTPEYFEDVRQRPLLSGYLFDSIREIIDDRDPEGVFSNGSVILDSHGQPPTLEPCSRCGTLVYAYGLWGEATWDYLSLPSETLGTYLFPSMSTFLKGQLGHNSVEIKHVEALLIKTPFKEIFRDIFAKGLKLPAYPDKNSDDYWCYACMTAFLKDHLHLWVAVKRKEANEKIANDCWYGYNCRTQVHKLIHAQQLNHLCEPTR